MSINPQQNGNIAIKKNDTVFYEGQNTQSVNILLQGKMDVYISPLEKHIGMTEEDIIKKSYKVFTVNQNLFLGVNDLCTSKKYSFSYRASEDLNLYVFSAHSMEQVKVLISSQKDYAACIITSICNLIEFSYAALTKLERLIRTLHVLTDNLIVFYWALKEEYGFSCTPGDKYVREGLDNLQKMRDKNFPIPSVFNASFFERDYAEIYETEYKTQGEINTSKIEYYKHLSNLSMELRKNYFAEDYFIVSYQCKDATKCLNDIQTNLKDTFIEAGELFKRLYSEDGECIFSEYVKAANDLKKNNQNASMMIDVIDYIVTQIKSIVSTYENEYGHACDVDMDYLKNALDHVKMGADSTLEVKQGEENIPEELRDSALKILGYSGLPKERADLFWSNLEAFRKLKDKLSSDNEVRNIRNAVTGVFFEIYDAVFKKVTVENNKTRIYHMFLNYAYMDERLLSAENTLALYKLSGKQAATGQVPVYNIKEWLGKIAEKEREPSINEFGQDYYDIFREAKRRKEIADRDMIELENDIFGKIKFEIDNMFRINQRVSHGQVSVYFPILHNEMITKDLTKAIVTPEMISAGIKRILEVDYAAFHREISYRNTDIGLEKEFIMKSVLPDIILMPTFGSRATMWQEIAGRNRSAPGRFIFPAFTGENLEDLLLKIVGNFRWELCRTMMGVSWNDVSQKSLTSEYTDYIQFYKKNRDLTEEAREKIRAQTQKYRNMMREIFTSDYETWINYESKGNVRLNKVVRGIFYRHCPFSRPIREYLEKQPMYSEIATQFRNLRAKEAKELENHYNKLVKSGLPLDEECALNLKFYKEM